MMKDISKKDIKIVAFDAFDTLVYYNKSHKHGVYGEILDILSKEITNGQDKQLQNEFIQKALTQNIKLNFLLQDIQKKYHIKLSHETIQQIEKNLTYEIESIKRYVDALPTIQQLNTSGFKTAVISNLARPYGEAIEKQLKTIDSILFSYKVATTKPNPLIYQQLAKQQNIEMCNILMIGNNPQNDYNTPIKLGMQSLLLDRNGNRRNRDDNKKIESLEELTDILP